LPLLLLCGLVLGHGALVAGDVADRLATLGVVVGAVIAGLALARLAGRGGVRIRVEVEVVRVDAVDRLAAAVLGRARGAALAVRGRTAARVGRRRDHHEPEPRAVLVRGAPEARSR